MTDMTQPEPNTALQDGAAPDPYPCPRTVAAIVEWLQSIDEYHELALRLSANCEAPDCDLSWTMPFIAGAIAAGEPFQQGGK
jgi:hypothetical protein